MYQKKTHENIKEYYGRILENTSDLKTSACCCGPESMPIDARAALREIDDEIINRFYGCGSPIPPLVEGLTILDLGCGTGRDVYIASRLAGENGLVIGVDMTGEQIEVAQRHVDSMTRKFGYKQPNVEFKKGYIEDLKSLGIEDDSVDVVISNCVINLSPDKKSVFSEIFRVLKPGGELYFSDIFSGRRIPAHLTGDPVLHGECLAGAMYIEDFRRLLTSLGCPDYRVTSKRKIQLGNPEIEEKTGMVDFYSMTIRAFALQGLEDIGEDYGQVAVYKGTIPFHPHCFELDLQHRFITGKPKLVCGNTALMLQETRFAPHFEVHGDRVVHFGPFVEEPAGNENNNADTETTGGGCC